MSECASESGERGRRAREKLKWERGIKETKKKKWKNFESSDKCLVASLFSTAPIVRGGYARHGRTPINGRPSPPASNSGLGLVICSCCRHLKTVFPPFCFVSLARHGLGLEVSLFLFRTTEERLTFLIFSSSSSSSFSLLLRNTRAARFACRGDRNFWLEYLCSLFAGTKRDSKDLGRHGKKNFPRLYKQFSNQLRSEGKGSSSPNATAGFVRAACVSLEKKIEKKEEKLN